MKVILCHSSQHLTEWLQKRRRCSQSGVICPKNIERGSPVKGLLDGRLHEILYLPISCDRWRLQEFPPPQLFHSILCVQVICIFGNQSQSRMGSILVVLGNTEDWVTPFCLKSLLQQRTASVFFCREACCWKCSCQAFMDWKTLMLLI